MALLFPKSIDKYVKIGGGVLAVLALGGVGAYAYFSNPQVLDTGYSPKQPVPLQSQAPCRQYGDGLLLLPCDGLQIVVCGDSPPPKPA
jgi:Predicted membrane protein